MKEIARIVRRGKNNSRVEFTDGVRAFIPTELAKIGQEIDSNRLFIFTEYTGKKGLRWKGNNSILYKHRRAETETCHLGDEIWTQFFEIVRACLCKFISFGRVKSSEVKYLSKMFISDAVVSCIPVRMAEKSQELRGGYIYSCVKGWLLNRCKELYKERGMFVSFEECEDFLSVDDSSLLTVLES